MLAIGLLTDGLGKSNDFFYLGNILIFGFGGDLWKCLIQWLGDCAGDEIGWRPSDFQQNRFSDGLDAPTSFNQRLHTFTSWKCSGFDTTKEYVQVIDAYTALSC